MTIPVGTSNVRTDVASLAIVIGTAAVIGITSGMFTPLLSLKGEAAGISSFWNGALAGVPSLAILLSGLFYPPVIRRLGILSSFYLATATAAIAAILIPQFDKYWFWLALRFLMGGALGLQWVVSESWINGLAAGQRRGTILGIYIAVFSSGLALGPLILSYTGSEGFLPFATGAALLIVCGLPLPFAQLPKQVDTPEPPRSIGSTLRMALAENIAGFIHGARYTSSVALLPLYAIHLGSEPHSALQLLTATFVGSLLFQPVSGRLIDRFSPRAMLLACGWVQAASCALLAFVISSDILVWPLMLVWGASGGAIYTASITSLGAKFSTRDLPAATTGFLITWEGGAVLGPLLTGAAMQMWDPHGMMLVLAVLSGTLVLVSLRQIPVPQPT